MSWRRATMPPSNDDDAEEGAWGDDECPSQHATSCHEVATQTHGPFPDEHICCEASARRRGWHRPDYRRIASVFARTGGAMVCYFCRKDMPAAHDISFCHTIPFQHQGSPTHRRTMVVCGGCVFMCECTQAPHSLEDLNEYLQHRDAALQAERDHEAHLQDELREHIASMRRTTEEERGALRRLTQEAQAVEAECEQEQAKLTSCEAELEALRTQSDQRQARVREILACMDELNDQLNAKHAEMHKAKGQILDVEMRTLKKTAELTKVTESLTHRCAKLQHVERALQTHERDEMRIRNYEQTQLRLQDQWNALQQTKAGLHTETTQVQALLQTHQKALHEADDVLKKLMATAASSYQSFSVPVCDICFLDNSPLDTVVVPCGHMFCASCAVRCVAESHCFRCRTAVTQSMRVYYP